MVPQSEYLAEGSVILALQSHMGNIGLAATELGLTRGELFDYMARHPAVAETRKQIREAVKDDAEDILIRDMRTDHSLLVFFLRTQAKDRGYSTTSESTINNKVEVNVDARSLISAMRNGAHLLDVTEDEEEQSVEDYILDVTQGQDEEDEPEDGRFFPNSKLLDHGDGS
jgi:hypothetical protein